MLRGAPPKPAKNSDEGNVAHNREDECIPIISHDSFSLLAQRQSGDLFEPRDGGLVFGEVLPILFIEVQHVEERSEHRLEVLFVRLVGREARLKRGTRLRSETFAVNLEKLRSLPRDDVLRA